MAEASIYFCADCENGLQRRSDECCSTAVIGCVELRLQQLGNWEQLQYYSAAFIMIYLALLQVCSVLQCSAVQFLRFLSVHNKKVHNMLNVGFTVNTANLIFSPYYINIQHYHIRLSVSQFH